jgi:HK97 family phage portal protein
MSWRDWAARNILRVHPAHDRALTNPIYRFGQFRTGITATEQQATPAQLVTDGFAGVQATATRAIGNRVSDLEFRVQEHIRAEAGTATWEDNDTHPLLAVLQRPNMLLSRRQLMKVTSYWLTLTGEAFWLIVTNGAGATRELWPMSPRNVEKLASDALPVAGYVFHGDKGETHYSPDEVVWMFDPDPADPFKGVGVVGPQARDFDAGTFASDTVRNHFRQDATPKTVLKATDDARMPDPEQKNAFWADWGNRYNKRGGENVGLPAFLPSGFDIQELGGASNIEEAKGIMEHLRDTLLMASGVPRSILGDVVDANRAAADTNRLVFDRHTIKPQVGLICDALTHQLAVPEFGVDTRVVVEAFVSDDEDLRLREEQQDLSLKVRSINQVRQDRGLDPVEWGKDPIGSFSDQPYSGEPGANLFAPSEQESGPDDSDDSSDEPMQEADEELEAEQEEGRAFLVRREQARIAAHFAPEAAWSRVLQAEAEFIPLMLSNLRRVFAGQKALTLDFMAKNEDLLRAIQGGYSRADLVEQLFELEDMTRLFDVLVTPIREDVFKKSGEAVLQGLGKPPLLSFQEAAIKTMRAQGAELVKLANATTKAKIRRTLAKGIEEGEGFEKLSKRVREEYKTISKSRARTIARTEVGHAVTSGQLEGYDQSEIVAEKQWNSALDEKVRDTHGGPGHLMDGVRVALVDNFTLLDGEQAKAPRVAPGGGRLSAHNGINCRCFETPIVEGDQGI